MKNIRVYNAKKYNSKAYIKVEENIYQKVAGNQTSDNSLSLQQVEDEETLKILNGLTNWETGKNDMEEDLFVVVYNGKKYYKDIDDEEEIIFENMCDDAETCYVTSLMFEQEPELGENEPSDSEVSQYPLEDILDKFFAHVMIFTKRKTKKTQFILIWNLQVRISMILETCCRLQASMYITKKTEIMQNL